ncbi:MAG: hypothetical protein ACOX4A_04170 [Saccharofermentanales bacterium]
MSCRRSRRPVFVCPEEAIRMFVNVMSTIKTFGVRPSGRGDSHVCECHADYQDVRYSSARKRRIDCFVMSTITTSGVRPSGRGDSYVCECHGLRMVYSDREVSRL